MCVVKEARHDGILPEFCGSSVHAGKGVHDTSVGVSPASTINHPDESQLVQESLKFSGVAREVFRIVHFVGFYLVNRRRRNSEGTTISYLALKSRATRLQFSQSRQKFIAILGLDV